MQRFVEIWQYRLPLKQPITVAGKQLSQRSGLIVRLNMEGRCGIGEIAPLPGVHQESLDQSRQQLLQFTGSGANLSTILEHKSSYYPSVRCGIEQAAWQLGLGPVEFHKIPERVMIRNTGLITQAQPDNLVNHLNPLRSLGFQCFKIKMPAAQAVEYQGSLRDLMLSMADCSFRWDFNRRINLKDGRRLLMAWKGLKNLDYFEETRGVEDRVAWDESLWQQDFQRPGTRIIKAARLGSLEQIWGWRGQPMVFSNCYETGISIIHYAAMIAALELTDIFHGFGTYGLLLQNLLKQPLPLHKGKGWVPTRLDPGMVDWSRLEQLA